jgi:glycosyltransferase involved in cell wall biosynthesis
VKHFVVALIATRNEADIIGHVVRDLTRQGIGVYILDDGSTDATLDVVAHYQSKGVIGIEHLAETIYEGPSSRFELARIVERKAKLASELDAEWFINHDADEFREAPFADVSFESAIRRVDALGFNAIDFELLNFWPVHDNFRPEDDVRQAFKFYAPAAPYDRVQVRCWKKGRDVVDLASSAGHDVRFAGRRVFPIRFILRHYPIRGQAHGERKTRDRLARFADAERARGWHVQYDDLSNGGSFIRDPQTLMPYDPEKIRMELLIRNRDVDVLEARHDALMQDLTGARQDLEQMRTEAGALSTEVARLVRTVQQLEHRVQDGALEAEELRREGDNLRREVENSHARLDAMHRSLSWRWTSPARTAFRVLTGGHRKGS